MKKIQQNKGFSLIELLVSMALLSIIMLMVVQFMSTTTAANKRAKYNMKSQTSASELMTHISESIAVANYVQVVPYDSGVYEKPEGVRKEAMATGLLRPTKDKAGFTFNLVCDNYVNFVRNTSREPDERKVIIDRQTYKFPGVDKDTYYPLNNDLDTSGTDVRSFRAMKQVSNSGDVSFLYTKPAYIYIENSVREENSLGILDEVLYYTIYRFDYSDPDNAKIYVYRQKTAHDRVDKVDEAQTKVNALSGEDGLLTDNLTDFYLSCDAEGGAFMLDALMNVKGYQYNVCETVILRNSNVLTPKPHLMYELGTRGSNESWSTPEDENSSESEE
ncbi:MAG: type II secretion system protein J [Lachnospiraceae bacterium]